MFRSSLLLPLVILALSSAAQAVPRADDAATCPSPVNPRELPNRPCKDRLRLRLPDPKDRVSALRVEYAAVRGKGKSREITVSLVAPAAGHPKGGVRLSGFGPFEVWDAEQWRPATCSGQPGMEAPCVYVRQIDPPKKPGGPAEVRVRLSLVEDGALSASQVLFYKYADVPADTRMVSTF